MTFQTTDPPGQGQKFLKYRPLSYIEAHTAFQKQKLIWSLLLKASEWHPLSLRMKSKLLPGLTKPIEHLVPVYLSDFISKTLLY